METQISNENQTQPKPKKPWYKKWWIWVIAGVVTCGVIGAVVPKNETGNKDTQLTTPPTTVSISQVEKKTEAKTEAAVETQAAPATTVKPTEAPTEAATQAQESVLFEQNGVKIVYKGLGSSWMGQSVELRIENTSNKNYTVQTRDVSVNGFMVNEMFSCDVNSGKIANDEITFLKSEFEKNGIEKIENIELTFHVFNSDDWEDSFNSQPISLTF